MAGDGGFGVRVQRGRVRADTHVGERGGYAQFCGVAALGTIPSSQLQAWKAVSWLAMESLQLRFNLVSLKTKGLY